MKHILYAIALTMLIFTSCSHESDIVVKTRLLLDNGLRPDDGEMAIFNGKIIFVGEKARPYISSQTRVIIYEDGLLMPGFVNCAVSGITSCKTANPTSTEIITMQKHLASNGVVMYEESNGRELHALYMDMDRKGELLMPVFAEYELYHDEDFLAELDNLIENVIKNKSEFFQFNAIKIVLDGKIEDRAALLTMPYCDQKGFFGKRIWSSEELDKIIERANGAGIGVHAYCVGDGATHDFIQAIQRSGKSNTNNSIIGLELVCEKDLSLMAELNIGAVVNPWEWQNNEMVREKIVPMLGEERAGKIFPLNSLLKNGINVAFGSCFPTPFDMQYNFVIYNMVYRNDPFVMETMIGPEEKIDITRALQIMSLGGFKQLGLEDGNGILKKSMIANLVLSNQDLIEAERLGILNSHLICTISNGKIIFKGR